MTSRTEKKYIYDKGKAKKISGLLTVFILLAFLAGLILVGWRLLSLLEQRTTEEKVSLLYDMTIRATSVPVVDKGMSLSPGETLKNDDIPKVQTILPQFELLLEENGDTVGWLNLPNTNINHVVVQGNENLYYLENNFYGQRSVAASMMLDFRNDVEELKGHYIIYGHRIRSGKMMNAIVNYDRKEFFYENPIIHFDTIYSAMDWEVFSIYTQEYDFYNTRVEFDSASDWLSYIKALQRESLYETDIELRAADVVLTLYTCDYDFREARYVVHARLINNYYNQDEEDIAQ